MFKDSATKVNKIIIKLIHLFLWILEKLLSSCKRPGVLLMIVFAASLLSCGEHDHDEVRLLSLIIIQEKIVFRNHRNMIIQIILSCFGKLLTDNLVCRLI